MPQSLFDRLALFDAAMLASGRPAVAAEERRAIQLTNSVNPEAGRGFDWLVPEAASTAKIIHHEQSADFLMFAFDDRSLLVLLQTGFVYSVASCNADSLGKVEAWLKTHSIASGAPAGLAAANQPFDVSG
ncbi:MAG: hypothetical protein ACNJA3_27960 (plasmid) [Pseudomonas rhizophila]|uniref:hypothetical protein n=1 Tax=Pseudomonas rhizophila TaxID=2045200 RepID=UPI003F6D0AC2